MALTDPFSTTYAGAFKGGSALGEGLQSIAEAYAGRKEREAEEAAKLKLEKEKARIKAETPSFLDTLMVSMLESKPELVEKLKNMGRTDEAGTVDTGQPAQPSVLDAEIMPEGGVTIGGALRQPRVDPLLTLGAKYRPLDLEYGKAQIGIAKKKAEVSIKGEEKIATKKGEFIGGAEIEPFKASFNMELVANAFSGASAEHADAYRQGGVGDIGKSIMSALRLRMGGVQAEALSAVQATPGKYTEALLKMMPILTQQVGKEGTIRIIQGVFEKMGETIPTFEAISLLDPHKAIPAKTARRMMANTLDSLLRFTRATEFLQADIGLLKKQEGEMDTTYQQRLDAFTERLARVSSRIQFSPEEKQAAKQFIDNSLKPIDDYILERDTGIRTFETEEEVGSYKGQAIIGGKRAVID